MELPNRALNPRDAYEFYTSDIGVALEEWFRGDDSDNDLALWHSHPSGFIGPSEVDLHNKVESVGNLVIALVVENGVDKPVFTWY